ncbi:MAG: hypothetical protein PQJ44_06235 [Sphaerochaetaceae bacterium]|nr:hypothetical protein [Sphaerochaetaceae bacterium]
MASVIPSLTIDTGAPRSVTGHVISGALAAGVLSGALNYDKYKKGEIEKKEALNNSLKLSLQGGIATGSAVAAANYIGENSILNSLSAISVGVMGIYAIEKLADKFQNIENEIQSEEE